MSIFVVEGPLGGIGGDEPSVNPITGNAINDAFQEHFKKGRSPYLRGGNWDALDEAIATGDTYNSKLKDQVAAQLFLATASSSFLEQIANDIGIVKPQYVGLSDTDFRHICIEINARKLVPAPLWKVLDIFYGRDAVRAYSQSELTAPFSLVEDSTLEGTIDGKYPFAITIDPNDYQEILLASAEEVAIAFTRDLYLQGLKAYFVPIYDKETGLQHIRLYSGSRGIASSVQITGGTAQTNLMFPSIIGSPASSSYSVPPGIEWDITQESATTYRFSAITSDFTDISLFPVQEGDYVNIHTPFQSENRGSFEITSVGIDGTSPFTQYFEIENKNAIEETVTTTSDLDIVFFRKTVRRIQENLSRSVTVSSAEPGYLDISIPATSEAVHRTNETAAYLQSYSSIGIESVVRNYDGTITVSTFDSHGLSVGDRFVLDGIFPVKLEASGSSITKSIQDLPSVDAGNGTSTTDASQVSLFTAIEEPPTGGTDRVRFGHTITKLDDTTAVVIGGGATQSTDESATDFFSIDSTAVIPSGDATGRTRYTYSWNVGDVIPQTRRWHTSSLLTGLLLNGKVFVAGGLDRTGGAGTILDDCRLYTHQATGSDWSSALTMPTAKALHTSTLLKEDGEDKVFLVGGLSANDSVASAADSIITFTPDDSGTGSFEDNGTHGLELFQPRFGHEAVAYNSDKMLVIGGRIELSTPTSGADIPYANDPSPDADNDVTEKCESYTVGGSWSKSGSMQCARADFGVIGIPTGYVFVIGGYGRNKTRELANRYLEECEMWSPYDHSWSSIGKMSTPRRHPVVAYLPETQRILVSGGFSALGTPVETTEVFDIRSGKWNVIDTGALSAIKSGSKVSVLYSETDLPLIYGGYDGTWTDGTTISSETKLYIPGSDAISSGQLDKTFTVDTTPSATSFTFIADAGYYMNFSTDTSYSSYAVVPMGSVSGTGRLGPWLVDTDGSTEITGVSTTILEDILNGQKGITIKVNSINGFTSDSGYLAISFGYENQIIHVPYIGKYIDGADHYLVLDYEFDFDRDVLSGEVITLLNSKDNWIPSDVPSLSYITHSASGRIAAVGLIEEITAASVNTRYDIRYPSDIGLGNAGYPTTGNKVTDAVRVWGSNVLDEDIAALRDS